MRLYSSTKKEKFGNHDQAWMAFAAELERIMQTSTSSAAMSGITNFLESAIPVEQKLALAKDQVLKFLERGKALAANSRG